jgi:hypothetical protein
MHALRSITLRWIALAFLGCAVLAPTLHVDHHDDHAATCPYCHLASGFAFELPLGESLMMHAHRTPAPACGSVPVPHAHSGVPSDPRAPPSSH